MENGPEMAKKWPMSETILECPTERVLISSNLNSRHKIIEKYSP